MFHPGRSAPSALVLTCTPGHVTLDGERPESASVLLGRPSEPLLDFGDGQVSALAAGPSLDGQLAFAPRPSLTSRIEERGGDRRALLRRGD